VLKSLGREVTDCACLFSAGYSSGWCSDAFGSEVHGREIRCTARGDASCEFLMAPASRLDEHERRLKEG
jgi:predicted hydrocarbon binding protein